MCCMLQNTYIVLNEKQPVRICRFFFECFLSIRQNERSKRIQYIKRYKYPQLKFLHRKLNIKAPPLNNLRFCATEGNTESHPYDVPLLTSHITCTVITLKYTESNITQIQITLLCLYMYVFGVFPMKLVKKMKYLLY